MNEEQANAPVDPELEARIVALVLGEASDLESEELARWIDARPELARITKRFRDVHGLLQEMAAGERAAEGDDWKLAVERRNAILEAIGGETDANAIIKLVRESPERHASRRGAFYQKLSAIAAILFVAAVLGNLSLPASRKTDPSLANRSRRQQHETENLADSETGRASSRLGATPSSRFINDSYGASPSQGEDAKGVVVHDYNEDSARALFAIQNSIRGSNAAAPQDASGRESLGKQLGEQLVEGKEAARAKSKEVGNAGGVFDAGDAWQDTLPLRPLRRVESRLADLAATSTLEDGAEAPVPERGLAIMGGGRELEEVDSVVEAGRGLLGSSFGLPPIGSDGEAIDRLARKSERDWDAHDDDDAADDDEAGDKATWRFGGVRDDSSESPKNARETSAPAAGLEEKNAADEPFSTFSLHVGDVSFQLARAALSQGQWPEAARIRLEEFVNAFDYGDPTPSRSERVACRIEQAVHPFAQQRNLLRVSMRTAAAGRSSATPLRLTLLLDNSGSMERADRQQTVRRAFALLARQLKPIDQATLIGFARQPRLLADQVSGAEARQLVELVEDLPSEGGTNFEAALQLALEKAQEQKLDQAQNRIILLTDGAVNLGDADPDGLARLVAAMRSDGIAFDAAGICAAGLNDHVLEALTRNGDGRYYLIDSPEDADDGFARQIAGALRPAAANVKVQIEFNPQRVGSYRLLGFEQHRLQQEDFRNDQVDAAEMTAAEAGTAIYQLEAKPDGDGDVGTASVRFQDVVTGEMIERRWPIPYEAEAPRVENAAPSLRIAAAAALLAANLRGEPLGETVDLKTLSQLIDGLPENERRAERVQQLQQMIQQARRLRGQ